MCFGHNIEGLCFGHNIGDINLMSNLMSLDREREVVFQDLSQRNFCFKDLVSEVVKKWFSLW